jgi:diamine oxidase
LIQVNSVYLDTAWGFGASAFPLKAGIDCPETAAFLDVVQLFQTSEPQVHKNAICVFEKDGAIPLRRHFDVGGTPWPHRTHNGMLGDPNSVTLTDPYNFYAGTATHALVFRHAVTDYNYDYVLVRGSTRPP